MSDHKLQRYDWAWEGMFENVDGEFYRGSDIEPFLSELVKLRAWFGSMTALGLIQPPTNWSLYPVEAIIANGTLARIIHGHPDDSRHWVDYGGVLVERREGKWMALANEQRPEYEFTPNRPPFCIDSNGRQCMTMWKCAVTADYELVRPVPVAEGGAT